MARYSFFSPTIFSNTGASMEKTEMWREENGKRHLKVFGKDW